MAIQGTPRDCPMSEETDKIDKVIDEILDEGVSTVVKSKARDLLRGLVFKPQPIVTLYDHTIDETVSLKIKRGILKHSLILSKDSGDKLIATSYSAIILVVKALKASKDLISKGYIEI